MNVKRELMEGQQEVKIEAPAVAASAAASRSSDVIGATQVVPRLKGLRA
jgi:hypothetical protein